MAMTAWPMGNLMASWAAKFAVLVNTAALGLSIPPSTNIRAMAPSMNAQTFTGRIVKIFAAAAKLLLLAQCAGDTLGGLETSNKAGCSQLLELPVAVVYFVIFQPMWVARHSTRRAAV